MNNHFRLSLVLLIHQPEI